MDERRCSRRAEGSSRTPSRFAGAAQAGSDLFGVGDAAAGLISAEMFEEFVVPWQQKLFAGIHVGGAAVKLHICGNINHILGAGAQRRGHHRRGFDGARPHKSRRGILSDRTWRCAQFQPTAVLCREASET